MFYLELFRRAVVLLAAGYIARRIYGFSHSTTSIGESVVIDRTPVGVVIGEGIPAAILIAAFLFSVRMLPRRT